MPVICDVDFGHVTWTLFQHVRDMLYAETRQMLEALELRENGMGLTHVEEAQAWLLVAFYEFLRTNYRRG